MIFTEWTIETPIDQIIGEALGAASMCWEFPEKAGVFNSDRAAEILQETVDIIFQKRLA